ncbi:unnamed protein product [Spirodela intermedia]|uniref:Protein THYLAKOID RHODANESE-LIKE, chloroplastic n=1 Tax=Spirodela intermedia TaxID=51605 RepID=A0A7I8JP78_SPIIN|nr:unnamed protein product [Spirodela intermedia]CAA6671571.1 unnamed protein product [Spirodela intermedia]
MEVLNAARVSPVSLHKPPVSAPERRLEPKKILPFKLPHRVLFSELESSVASKAIGGGLGLMSSVLSSVGSARGLTYEEALGQSVRSPSLGDVPDVDIGKILDGIISFGSENPLLLGGGALALAVPLVLSQVFKSSPKAWGVDSTRSAFSKLSEDAGAQLLDIRGAKDFKEVGAPDIRSLKKKAVSIVYTGDDKPSFLKKLSLKFKDPENTTLFILDKFDGNSEFVAELATANGFKAAFAIKDGAEGPRGWVMIGKALLPASTAARASLPSPVQPSTDTPPAPSAEKVESVPEAPPKEPKATVLKAETAAEPPQEVNSVPDAEVKAESVSGLTRSLSPYPYYPDFKPPSSPCPSQP